MELKTKKNLKIDCKKSTLAQLKELVKSHTILGCCIEEMELARQKDYDAEKQGVIIKKARGAVERVNKSFHEFNAYNNVYKKFIDRE